MRLVSRYRLLATWVTLAAVLGLVQHLTVDWVGGLEPGNRCFAQAQAVGAVHQNEQRGVASWNFERWPPRLHCVLDPSLADRQSTLSVSPDAGDWAWLSLSSIIGAGLLTLGGVLLAAFGWLRRPSAEVFDRNRRSASGRPEDER